MKNQAFNINNANDKMLIIRNPSSHSRQRNLISKSRFAFHIVSRTIKQKKQQRRRQFIISPRALNSINYLLSNIVIKWTIYKLLYIYINISHLAAQARPSSHAAPCLYFLSCRSRFFVSLSAINNFMCYEYVF